MLDLGIPLLGIGILIAFVDWRKGLLVMIFTMILQDPIRKLSPLQPLVFVIFSAIIFGAACIGAWLQRVPLSPFKIYGWNRQLATPTAMYLLLLVFQAFHSYSNFGSTIIAALGIAVYLAPMVATGFAYQIAVDRDGIAILQFFRWYAGCTFIALTTVYLQSINVDWSILGDVGPGLYIYDRVLGVIKANSGIYRASEIAAWHAATCACFAFILITFRKLDIARIAVAAIVIIFLLWLSALTGRRKSIVQVGIFLICFFALWAIFARAAAKLAMALAVVGVIAFVVFVIGSEVDTPERLERSASYDGYMVRSQSVFTEIPSRSVELGVAPVLGTFSVFGILGAGIGVATQGVQNFVGAEIYSLPGYWLIAGATEGGLGKIMVELGVGGLVLIIWLGIAGVRHMWWIMGVASKQSPELGRLSYGLFSFLVANVAAFSVATQAFGDPSILILLSVTLGFMLAIPVLGTQIVPTHLTIATAVPAGEVEAKAQ